MAKIAVLFYFPIVGVKPCYYEQLETALVQGKHIVLSINTYVERCDNSHFTQDHISEIERFKPELIITFNHVMNKLIYNKTTCPVFVIEADTVKYFPNLELITDYQDRVWVGVAQEGRINLFKEKFPFLCSDRFVYYPNSTLLEKENIEQDINISCIATLIGFSMSEDIIVKNTGRTNFSQFKSIVDQARTDINLLTEEDYDTLRSNYKELFRYISYKNRAQVLDALAPFGLKVFGDFYYPAFFAAALPDLFLSLQKEKVFSMKENQDIYNRSIISVNVHFAHNSTIDTLAAYSWRVCDIMATNACLLSTYCPAIKRDFSKWVDIPMFKDRFEANQLAGKILKDEPLRKNIVQGCQAAIKEGGFTFEKRLIELEALFGLNKSLEPDKAFIYNKHNEDHTVKSFKSKLSHAFLPFIIKGKNLIESCTNTLAMLRVLGLSILAFFSSYIIVNLNSAPWMEIYGDIFKAIGLFLSIIFVLQFISNITYKICMFYSAVIKKVNIR